MNVTRSCNLRKLKGLKEGKLLEQPFRGFPIVKPCRLNAIIAQIVFCRAHVKCLKYKFHFANKGYRKLKIMIIGLAFFQCIYFFGKIVKVKEKQRKFEHFFGCHSWCRSGVNFSMFYRGKL